MERRCGCTEFVENEIWPQWRQYHDRCAFAIHKRFSPRSMWNVDVGVPNLSGIKFGRNSQVNTGIVGRQCVAMASISRSLCVWLHGCKSMLRSLRVCLHGRRYAEFVGNEIRPQDVIPLPDRHRLRHIGQLSNLLCPRQKRTLNWQHLLGFGYDLVEFDQSMTA